MLAAHEQRLHAWGWRWRAEAGANAACLTHAACLLGVPLGATELQVQAILSTMTVARPKDEHWQFIDVFAKQNMSRPQKEKKHRRMPLS